MNVRPAIRNLAIIAAIVLTPVVAHQLWDYFELRRLIAEIEAIRARGEPVTEQEAGMGRAPEPGEPQRAGRMYIAAALLAASEDDAVYSTVSGIHEWLSGAIAAPPAGAENRLRALVAAGSKALVLADEAGALAFQGFPPGTDYNYRTGELMMLSRLMAARSIGLAIVGEADAAIESALSGMKLRHALRDLRWPPGLVDGAEVPSILSLSQPSPDALRRLQDSLQADDTDRAVDEMLFARARYVESVWRHYYGSLPAGPRPYLLRSRSMTEILMRPWLTGQIVRTLRAWAELAEAARIPWPGRVDAAAAMETKYGERATSIPAGLLANLRRAARYYQRNSAYLTFLQIVRPHRVVSHRASVAAIAVERYRREHNGALPAALQELVPRYLAAVPEDPVTGQPLLFKKDTAAYTIYSVGPDKKDDRGDLNSELVRVIKQGHGPRIVRGADLGVRVIVR